MKIDLDKKEEIIREHSEDLNLINYIKNIKNTNDDDTDYILYLMNHVRQNIKNFEENIDGLEEILNPENNNMLKRLVEEYSLEESKIMYITMMLYTVSFLY